MAIPAIVWVVGIAVAGVVTYLLGRQMIETGTVKVGDVNIPIWMLFVVGIVILLIIVMVTLRRR